MNYTDFPEECILEIGYLKRKFKLMHTEPVASESGVYKLKFMFERVEDINKKTSGGIHLKHCEVSK